MKLKIISWNINFIHDNWCNRLKNINDILEKEVDTTHIIALQEATIPFGNKIKELYSFMNKKNINYCSSSLLNRDKLYKYINKYSKKKDIGVCFEYLMNKLMWLCGYIFSYIGEYHKKLYFEYPLIFLCVSLVCIPIFLGMWYFIGLMTITSDNITTEVKSKYVGNRIIQYFDFIYNNKEIRCVNIHLNPGTNEKEKEKRLNGVKSIIKLCKKKKNVVLIGDFNDEINSKMYKYMTKKGYDSIFKKLNKYVNTFPSDNPSKCIDYIMIKGDIGVNKISTFGGCLSSDHKGLKVELEV
jgi:endonuclease/exonuclease/phosphatase family metal-dependent hydrolase